MSWLDLVPAPSSDSVNTLTKDCPTQMLVKKFGPPRQIATLDDKRCYPMTNPFWKNKMSIVNVGPFEVYGFTPFLNILKKGFNDIRTLYPGLYDLIGNEGCVCVRLVRGSNSTLSNHSFGMAIDLSLGGHTVPLGSTKIHKGLFTIYDVLKHYYVFWGAGYHRVDAMHFEAGEKLVQQWIKTKVLS